MKQSTISFRHQISNCILGRGSAQRMRIGRSLTAAALYVAYILLMHVSVRIGLTDPALEVISIGYILSGPVLFYAMLRSGWNQRLANPDMTVIQMVFGITTLLLAYAVNPANRSAVLLILALVMVFGMFTLRPAQARGLTLFALAAFGVAMLGLMGFRPHVYDWRLEVLNFIILVAVLPSISLLAGQLARLRSRKTEQRVALEQALKQLERLVDHDELTGLVNRRYMLERLVQESKRRTIDATPTCICLIDLDHFKRINDCFGHAAGDEVLRRFAHLLQASLRGPDVLARWGGEEFLLLLPDADAAQACMTIDRLRARLADPVAWRDRPELIVTMSAGVAQWPMNELAEQAIERADQEAYRAKAGGRDRWSCDTVARSADR